MTKIFIAFFAPDERLPSSATLHDYFVNDDDDDDDDDRDEDHEDDHHLTSKATSPLGATSSLLVLNLLAGKQCIHK